MIKSVLSSLLSSFFPFFSSASMLIHRSYPDRKVQTTKDLAKPWEALKPRRLRPAFPTPSSPKLTCQSGAPTTQPSLRPRIHPRTTQHGSRRSPPRTCHPTSTATTARRLRHRSRGIIPRQQQQCLRLHPHRKRRKRSEAEAQKKRKSKKESKDTGRATSRRRRRR